MRVCTLASSSKGNSILVYSERTKILIDCGISLSELELKLGLLNINPSEISAVLITHEHSDHIKGIAYLSRKYGTLVFCHMQAYQSMVTKLGKIDTNKIIRFGFEPFEIGEFQITSFKVPHDAPFCVGFNIEKENKKISIATDLGHATDDIIKYLYNSRIVILEANHDENRLMQNPKYSSFLKQRILGKTGHLSNKNSADIIKKLAQNNVKQILLAHLSEENNTPEICYNTIVTELKNVGISVGENVKIDIASAKQISTIFYLK